MLRLLRFHRFAMMMSVHTEGDAEAGPSRRERLVACCNKLAWWRAGDGGEGEMYSPPARGAEEGEDPIAAMKAKRAAAQGGKGGKAAGVAGVASRAMGQLEA